MQNFVITYVDLLNDAQVSFFGLYLSLRIVRSMRGKVRHKNSEQNVSQSTTILSIAQLTPRNTRFELNSSPLHHGRRSYGKMWLMPLTTAGVAH